MKPKISTLILTTPAAAWMIAANAANAAAVAYWNFEDGSAGESFTPTGEPNGSGGSVDTVNDILMRGWNTTYGPSFTSTTAPNGGSLAMRNNIQDGYVTEGAIHNWSPAQWTIETTVNLNVVSGWKTLIGRDGSTVSSGESDFYLQKNGATGMFRVNLITAGDERVAFDGNFTIQAATWYGLAIRSDGTTLSMWLDDGSGYQEIGSADYSGTNNALKGSALNWTFGRGWYNGGFVDHIDGSMDNVRFSDTALAPQDMIALVPEPSAAALLALGSVTMLRRRRR
jgi:hypothetical protein